MKATVKFKKNKKVTSQIKKRIQKGLRQAGNTATDKVVGRMQGSASPTTLEVYGHPYARRYGSIQSTPEKPSDQVINEQSGRLVNSLKGRSKGFVYTINFQSPPFYAKFVFKGTKVMLPRNPFKVLMETGVQKGIIEAFKKGSRG